ncbi:hypothetical protein GCM10023224_33740 [Streptomonospora halophila]|uniref:5,10-methylene-tetrahydrofolate dehydrogenase/Methenyl tetrahydrofolate cyclohydrolase n=1 Tax=Streptomonospora halophila TaxID=427369 RepID=A0ABP9GUX2_9ACTN
MEGEDTAASGARKQTVVGIVAEPVAAPAKVAGQLARELPRLLAEQVDRKREWRTVVSRERLPPSDASHTAMMDVAAERMRRHGWDIAVCLTDVVLRTDEHPIIADAGHDSRIIVVSLPAFGGMALRRNVRGVVAQLIADMLAPDMTVRFPGRRPRGRRLPALSRRFHRVAPEQPRVDTRILASRGRLRLLAGMVRDNRPWRLAFALTGPLIGAFAFSAFYTINTTVWELATNMGTPRLVVAAFGSVAVMVVWLIVYHNLWEPTRGRPPRERGQAAMFNASTLLTLGIGVVSMFAVLYLVNLAAGLVVLAPVVFGRYVDGGLDAGDYVSASLLVSAAGTVAGAIGSGFESEASVREAAFSQRERARREALHTSVGE